MSFASSAARPAALLLAVVLAACGGSPGTPVSSTASPTPTTSARPTPTPTASPTAQAGVAAFAAAFCPAQEYLRLIGVTTKPLFNTDDAAQVESQLPRINQMFDSLIAQFDHLPSYPAAYQLVVEMRDSVRAMRGGLDKYVAALEGDSAAETASTAAFKTANEAFERAKTEFARVPGLDCPVLPEPTPLVAIVAPTPTPSPAPTVEPTVDPDEDVIDEETEAPLDVAELKDDVRSAVEDELEFYIDKVQKISYSSGKLYIEYRDGNWVKSILKANEWTAVQAVADALIDYYDIAPQVTIRANSALGGGSLTSVTSGKLLRKIYNLDLGESGWYKNAKFTVRGTLY